MTDDVDKSAQFAHILRFQRSKVGKFCRKCRYREVGVMRELAIRGIDEDTYARLCARAAENGRSTEAEARAILHEHLYPPAERGLGSRIHARFAALPDGGAELRAELCRGPGDPAWGRDRERIDHEGRDPLQ